MPTKGPARQNRLSAPPGTGSAGRRATAQPMTSIVVDLRKSSQELLAAMDKNTAYEIRRARDKDGVLCEHLPAENRAAPTSFGPFNCPLPQQLACPPPTRQIENGLRRWLRPGNWIFHGQAIRREMSWPIMSAFARRMPPSCNTHARRKAIRRHCRPCLVGRPNRFLFWSYLLRFKEDGWPFLRFRRLVRWGFGPTPPQHQSL